MAGGTLWVGTQGGGVLAWDTGAASFRKYTRLAGGLPADIIEDLAVDPARGDGLVSERTNALARAADGSIWIGTDFGVSVLAPRAAGAPFRRGDTDRYGSVSLTDAVLTFNFRFLDGPPPPPAPGPDACGSDPSADDLGCAAAACR